MTDKVYRKCYARLKRERGVVDKTVLKQEIKKERIRQLIKTVNEIKKRRILSSEEYVKEIERINKGVEDSRADINKATSKLELAKAEAIYKSWLAQKNILKEIRYALKIMESEEAKLELELLKLR